MKKRITTAAAVISAFALAGTTVYAASKFTANDLKDLSNSLLGVSDVKEGQDLTGDNVVNVYDIIKMRESFIAGTGEFAEQVIGITDSNTKYIGRNIYDDNKITWLVQSGSAVEFTVNAKSAEITINGDGHTESDEKYRPRYAVIVDDEIILDELLSVKEKTVKLFEGTAARSATVKVIHLHEVS